MKIESLILRKGGSYVSFGPHLTPEEVTYHFTGPEDGPHVCDVEDQKHIAMLLAVEPVAFRVVKGSSSVTPPAGDEGDGAGADLGSGTGDQPTPEDEMKQARADYRTFFGKNPGPKWDLATIRAKIAEAE